MKKQIFTLLMMAATIAFGQTTWNLAGNAGLTSGQYLGSTDNKDVIFKRFGVQSGIIGSTLTSFGTNSLNASTTGVNNAAFGLISLTAITSGYDNSAFGSNSLKTNTTGYSNTAFGRSSLYVNLDGYNNTAIGAGVALSNTSGYNNTAIGYSSFYTNTTGSGNTVVGYQADVSVNNLTKATAIGYNAKVSASNCLVLGGTGADAVNVGIGVTAPLAKLHVAGSAIIGTGMTSYPSGYSLYVSGGILTERVKVAVKTSGNWSWADFVFDENYNLLSLKEVEIFINKNKHLPGVPSAETIVKDGGIDVTQMLAKQMEKIEELTLYIIQLNKEIETLKTKSEKN